METPTNGCGRPSFGWPNVFSPEGCGPAIEDVWPSLFIGADRAGEMRRKVENLAWARAAVGLWRAEAEAVLGEEPRFVGGAHGGRSGMYLSDRGHHLIFDPTQCERMFDPVSGAWVAADDNILATWRTLQHERIRRLMTSLGFLYALTGDARYSEWVWRGLRALAFDLYAPERRRKPVDEQRYSVVYGGLYEAQTMLQTVQALALVEDGPGANAETLEALDTWVLRDAGDAASRWMDVMGPHNMTCWSMAGLAQVGLRLGRRDWVEKALYSERAGLRALLTLGVPRDPATGAVDGFWHETSSFYGCFYALVPLISLVRVGEAEGAMDDELRERFRAMFEAPLHLADPELRLVVIGDRTGPGRLTLPQLRHALEYAAGQVDAERFGPVLALVYARSGAPRTSLAALAWGPDALPEPCEPPRASVVMPAARMVTFRARTARGDVTCWFLGGEDAGMWQGHHHHDKLSLSLHAFGEIVTSDLGVPSFHDNVWAAFLNGTFSHNTLLIDEAAQGTMRAEHFEARLDAPVPWARARVRGDRTGPRERLWQTMVKRGDNVREGACEDVLLDRTVFFDPPYIVLTDRCEAPAAKRFGCVFHAYGSMVVSTEPDDLAVIGLPPLPSDGVYGLFVNRTDADPASRATADWRVSGTLWLRLVAASDAAFEATWGRTPGNPREETRGTLLLRAPGTARRFVSVLELHAGSPTVRGIEAGEAVTVRFADGGTRAYRT